jgi:hypothetical protein
VGKLCSAWFEGWEFGVVDLKFVERAEIGTRERRKNKGFNIF